jgi:hypothetical protein
MSAIELSIGVYQPSRDAAARLEQAGHRLYVSHLGWRVIVTMRLLGTESRRSHAHVVARDLIRDFGLEAVTEPPTVSLHDPEGDIDLKIASLVLEDARRASDPDPLQVFTGRGNKREKRDWYR